MDTNVEDVAVGTVAEFVERLESGGGKYAYFRGENRDYGDTRLTAAAFRKGKGMKEMEEMCNRFYGKVFAQLTPNEEQHFLAFCQHHWIPTCLLDITENPLMALYFACDKGDEQDGYVYCFADNFLDLTKLIDKAGTENFARGFFYIDSEPYRDKSLFDECYLKWHKENRKIEDAYSNMLIDYIVKSSRFLGKTIYKKIIAKIVSIERKQLSFLDEKDRQYFLEKLNTYMRFGDTKGFFDIVVALAQYDLLLYAALHCYISPRLSCETVSSIPAFIGLPKTIYKPLLSFGRAVAQHSQFIYQYDYDFGFVTDKPINKRVNPAHTIRISAQSKPAILRTLNTLGINRSTVYGDFDNIAQHIIETTP
ncbi:MAG: FRG domain-containing protein [Oscillospiraceae bacterium]|jgi:succinate dehydrogenase flavin-adding protein (antitoxin of CptAB toxin-antitoxin module)|nr:FRG domain-containing protein [Oscillospiraceae bacterium]